MDIQFKLPGNPAEYQTAVTKRFRRFVKAPTISVLTKISTYYSPLIILSLMLSSIASATSSKGVN